MTELRDARFKHALDTAPDTDARPAPAVANAIRAAARHALPAAAAPAAPRPWWQRLWQSTGSPRAPWSAAFASVLLAVLVTVLWVHEPIPDARPIAPTASSEPPPAVTTAPPPLRQAKPAPASPTGSGMAPTARTDKHAADEVAAPPAVAAEQTAAPMAEPAQPRAPASPSLPDQARARSKAYSAIPEEDAARAAKGQGNAHADAQALKYSSDTERGDTPVAAAPMFSAPQSAASPALPAPVAAASPPPQVPPPGAGRPDGLEAWTALHLELEGRTVTLDRARGQRLVAAMQRLALRAKPLPTPPSALPHSAPTLRLRILAQGQTLAELQLWDGVALWRRPGQVDGWADLTADEMAALLQPAQQALRGSPPQIAWPP